jgi:hypothetical protein
MGEPGLCNPALEVLPARHLELEGLTKFVLKSFLGYGSKQCPAEPAFVVEVVNRVPVMFALGYSYGFTPGSLHNGLGEDYPIYSLIGVYCTAVLSELKGSVTEEGLYVQFTVTAREHLTNFIHVPGFG